MPNLNSGVPPKGKGFYSISRDLECDIHKSKSLITSKSDEYSTYPYTYKTIPWC